MRIMKTVLFHHFQMVFFSFLTMQTHAQACLCWSKYTTSVTILKMRNGLRQQFDVDQLFEWEHFDFERSVWRDVSSISCRIRGVRDPKKRKDQPQQINPRYESVLPHPYIDDGTRTVKIQFLKNGNRWSANYFALFYLFMFWQLFQRAE